MLHCAILRQLVLQRRALRDKLLRKLHSAKRPSEEAGIALFKYTNIMYFNVVLTCYTFIDQYPVNIFNKRFEKRCSY